MQKYWYRLDTAALIFPATRRRNWANAFRVSACLKEDVDTEILQQAVDGLRHRFPSYYVTLRRGLFWYYLEESSEQVSVRRDYAYPLTFMSSRELKHNCMRILVYKNRIAAEFFHSLTDGRGGSIFLLPLRGLFCNGEGNPDHDPDHQEQEKGYERVHSSIPPIRDYFLGRGSGSCWGWLALAMDSRISVSAMVFFIW
jgi:hypothetical protein